MLLDSNIVIYSGLDEHARLRDFIERHAPSVSAVTHVEVLGFHGLAVSDRAYFEAFFARFPTLPVSDAVIRGAVDLRQRRRMSLGDALIAATALAHGLALVTRNAADFGWIDGLALVNPFDA